MKLISAFFKHPDISQLSPFLYVCAVCLSTRRCDKGDVYSIADNINEYIGILGVRPKMNSAEN